jgi:hypothetical protein
MPLQRIGLFGQKVGFLGGCMIVILLALVPCSVKSQTNTPATGTQQYVLTQIAAGKEAKLTGRKDRELDSKWLESLLVNGRGGASISHEGVLISGAVIRGKISLAGAEISFPVWLDDCQFNDDVDFSWSHFSRTLSLQDSVFRKEVDLDHVYVAGDLVIKDAQFQQPPDFSGATIDDELVGDGARFLSMVDFADFGGIQAAQGVTFVGASFPRGITFEHLKAPFLLLGRGPSDLQLQPNLPSLSTQKLNLSHSTIHGELRIINLDICSLVANDLIIEGTARISSSDIMNAFDLRQSHFSTLVLENTKWPTNRDYRQLAGINFQSIAPAPEDHNNLRDKDWYGLLTVVDQSAYNPGAYQVLETALRKEGYAELADSVFNRMNEEAVHAVGLGRQSRAKNLLLHYLIGYGRQPQYAFYWWIPVILLGWAVFARKSDVQARDPKDANRPYDAFWYSVDLFLPLTRLDAADVWMPRQDSWPRRYYARIHAALGWILVPIALAAVTGLIAVK